MRSTGALDLTTVKIEFLARATPKRDYYCQSRRGIACSNSVLARSRSPSPPLPPRRPGADRAVLAEGARQLCAELLKARDVAWATDLIPHLAELEDPNEPSPSSRYRRRIRCCVCLSRARLRAVGRVRSNNYAQTY